MLRLMLIVLACVALAAGALAQTSAQTIAKPVGQQPCLAVDNSNGAFGA